MATLVSLVMLYFTIVGVLVMLGVLFDLSLKRDRESAVNSERFVPQPGPDLNP